jgi:hemoglobin
VRVTDALVNRFYALMDQLPQAWSVRCLHPESLAGSADSLQESGR